MLVPDPHHIFEQCYTDIQYCGNYIQYTLFGKNQAKNESDTNLSKKEIKKINFDKIEFSNTCFRLGTMLIMAYSVYWYASTMIRLIKLPFQVVGMGVLHLLAYEGYVYSKAKSISLSHYINDRKNYWEEKRKTILQDSRIYSLYSLVHNIFSNHSKDTLKIEETSPIQEILNVDEVINLIKTNYSPEEIEKILRAVKSEKQL